MIKILRQGEYFIPILICDHCLQPIDRERVGVSITTDAHLAEGAMCDVAHAHKGSCHEAVERRFGALEAAVGWQELDRHLATLRANLREDLSDLPGLRPRRGDARF